jgi:NitT/TauT family transport system permease protein
MRPGLPDLPDSRLVTIGRLLVPVAVVLGWYLLSLALGQAVLPGPVRTVAAIESAVAAGWFVPNLQNTLVTLAVAFGIAAVSGFVLGAALGARETAYEVAEPFVLNTYAIPKIVLFPVFLFVFKLGMDQKVAFAVFHGFFPMLIMTTTAVREVPDIYRNVARSLRLGRVQTVRHVVAPFIVVHVVVGLRLAFSLTFLGVILAELFAAKSGIGLELRNAMSTVQTEKIMAIVTVLMVIAFLGNLLFYAVQGVLEARWNLTADNTI